jgi:hypothetical protein
LRSGCKDNCSDKFPQAYGHKNNDPDALKTATLLSEQEDTDPNQAFEEEKQESADTDPFQPQAPFRRGSTIHNRQCSSRKGHTPRKG